MSSNISEVRSLLKTARAVAVATGAGISAESGIPTFRGAGGLWRKYRAEDLATPEAFERDPQLVWEWYESRREMIAKAEPNPAHYALVKLESLVPNFTLITQNVDGLHERAGSRNVHRLHGSIWAIRCLTCGVEVEERRTPFPELPPRCACGGIMRPGVVWFGEELPRAPWAAAENAAESADVLLVVGTSAIVYPAALLVPMAANAGATVVEINAAETPISSTVAFSLRGPAGEILPQLVS